MARSKAIKTYDAEFPLLAAVGLYAVNTSGDGNCLFHSFSDQLHGHENAHREIRTAVVNHMREHKEYFKSFIDVGPTRRSSRRTAAKGRSDVATHSDSEIDRAYEERLDNMMQNGTYGDNLEIQAFARAYNVDVKVYQRDLTYVIQGGMPDDESQSSEPRRLVHIAYHKAWEHYSSVRNRDGPHNGPPNVTPRPLESGAEELSVPARSAVQGWMLNAVSTSLPYDETEDKMREILDEYHCDVNKAATHLIEAWEKENGYASRSPSEEDDAKDDAPIHPEIVQTEMSVETPAIQQEFMEKVVDAEWTIKINEEVVAANNQRHPSPVSSIHRREKIGDVLVPTNTRKRRSESPASSCSRTEDSMLSQNSTPNTSINLGSDVEKPDGDDHYSPESDHGRPKRRKSPNGGPFLREESGSESSGSASSSTSSKSRTSATSKPTHASRPPPQGTRRSTRIAKAPAPCYAEEDTDEEEIEQQVRAPSPSVDSPQPLSARSRKQRRQEMKAKQKPNQKSPVTNTRGKKPAQVVRTVTVRIRELHV